MPQHPALTRATTFCEQFNLRVPILMAPMASACPPSLAIAIANAGGLGGCGALMMQPEAIRKWAADVRAGTNGGFQFNLWIPDPPPKRDAAAESAMRDFLANWGPPVPPEAGNVVLPDFQTQCDALLEASPAIVSSIMGLYSDRFIARMKTKGIKWFATVTTASEAKTAERAGADAIIAQGMEAGGHRSAFDVTQAETRMVGLFSLISGVADAVVAPTAPPPAPYPVQRGLTQPMREAAAKDNDVSRMQAWAGQSARLARAEPAGEVVQRMWQETQTLLS